jgi:hypothetical protein
MARHPRHKPDPDTERVKLRRLAGELGLGGLASDTKWIELIDAFRAVRWTGPRYRCKCIDGNNVCDWDFEWEALPYPFSAIEWIDIFCREDITRDPLTRKVVAAKQVKDHSAEVEAILARIGLDAIRGKNMIRVFAYAPRNTEGFDENPPA